jgi:hypothetical protein
MIIKRAAKTVARDCDARERNAVTSQDVARGIREAGSAAAGMQEAAPDIVGAPAARCGIVASWGRNCPAFRASRLRKGRHRASGDWFNASLTQVGHLFNFLSKAKHDG